MFYNKMNFSNSLLVHLPPILNFLQYEKTKDEIKNLTASVKSCQIGELIIFNSGRVQFQIGKMLLDLERSFINKCEERLLSLDVVNDHCVWLGKIQPENHIITNYSLNVLL